MAQHDFAPAWLNFPTLSSTSSKYSSNIEKPTETSARQDAWCSAIRRHHSSSENLDSAFADSSWSNFGRKEKNVWRSQSRNGAENINPRMAYSSTGSRFCTSTFHSGKSNQESTTFEHEITWKEDWERCKPFPAIDFPSYYPENDVELSETKSVTTSVWEYPLITKSRTSPMLVTKQGMNDDFPSEYPIETSTYIQPANNMTDAPKTQTSKNGSSPMEHDPQCEGKNIQSDICLDSACDIFNSNASFFDGFLNVSQSPQNEGAGATCQERDLKLNFDTEEVTNGNSVISETLSRSPMFPQTDVLSSSLEAEHRLLKEMGWQEDAENDDIYAPLTEEELREFKAISEQLQKNGLRKQGFMKNCLSLDFKLSSWKNVTLATNGNEESETSSSDTSDDV
ncbi:vasculin isoform X2 [Pelobates cultripes]|uniref:Vasculin n=1 Tax=Pelobates cultripes TaxID=61616 RepID=A0AAD1SDY9_PELCU|nr:vasculin isoform X2 [Pelobates cultripes]